MTPELWEKVDEIFNNALEYPEGEREEYVKTVCTGDETLFNEVKALLNRKNKKDHTDSFLSNPPDLVKIVNSNLEQGKKLFAGEQFGNYKIVEHIGSGGYGEIYLAFNIRLERNTALKFIQSRFTYNEDYLNLFRQEAKTASALQHNNIVGIYDFIEENGYNIIAMEYIAGETLHKVLERSKLSLKKSIEISLDIAKALTHAHEKGIIHRDIKPANIMIPSNQNLPVKVLDFGIAGIVEDIRQNHQTSDGRAWGTTNYTSPEQARGERVDNRTDIWSLGAVLYQMITGQPPIEGQSFQQYTGLVNKDAPPLLSQFASNIPDTLQPIIDKALAKEPENRYETVEQFQADLESIFIDNEENRPRSSGFSWQDFLNDFFASERKSDLAHSLPALPLEDANSGNYPFDLGTVWGLDRSSYVGILTSRFDVPIYQRLCLIERILYEAGSAEVNSFNLFPRIWLEIDFNRFPNGPDSLDDISKAVIDENSPKKQILNQDRLVSPFILGFFCEVGFENYSSDFSGIIQNWCRWLIREESLRTKQIAVVIHLKGLDQNRDFKIASTILNELKAVNLPTRLEAMALRLNPFSSQNFSGEKLTINDLYHPSGSYCAAWFNAAVEDVRDKFLNDKSMLEKYSQLIEIIRPFASDFQSTLAWQVVKDLDQILSDNEQMVDAQLLHLTEAYLPDKLPELVREYADSNRKAARRQSLIFASRSDSLIDAWLEMGIETLIDFPLEDLFVAGPSGPFINNVVLGLLRYYRHGEKREKTKAIIQNLKSYLLADSDIYLLIEFCLGEINDEEFFDKLDLQKLLFAVRVGIDVGCVAVRLKNIDIDKTDLWHFLTSIPPTQETIDIFLQLECAKRVVLGLCTPNEWKEIKLDSLLLKQILACRVGRLLHFNN